MIYLQNIVIKSISKRGLTMEKIIIYHGSPNKVVIPRYDLGNDNRDYGKGFYITEDIELTKEWSVCLPNGINGYVHKFEPDTRGLKNESPHVFTRGIYYLRCKYHLNKCICL